MLINGWFRYFDWSVDTINFINSLINLTLININFINSFSTCLSNLRGFDDCYVYSCIIVMDAFCKLKMSLFLPIGYLGI